MPYPSLVIVPTSFCPSSMYDGQVKYLGERGYSVHALDPPSYPASYKADTPAPSMRDDAQFIGDFVTKLADEGKDVVILAHSYGAVPASQCLKGLTKNERIEAGKKGGVVRMAYLTAVVPKEGANTFETVTGGGGAPPQVDIDQYGWMSQTDPEQTVQMVFNHLPSEEGISWSKSFGRHAGAAFLDPLTHPGYRDVPVSWYFCEDDLSVVAKTQQNAITMIEQSWTGTERRGKKVDVTRSKCDHMPLFSATDHLNAWIENTILKGGIE